MSRVIQIDIMPYDLTGEGDGSSVLIRSGEAAGGNG